MVYLEDVGEVGSDPHASLSRLLEKLPIEVNLLLASYPEPPLNLRLGLGGMRVWASTTGSSDWINNELFIADGLPGC